jgi:hypothetical protein
MRFGQEFTENFHRWMSVSQDVTQNLIYSLIMRMMIVWLYCIIWRSLMKRTQIMLEDDKKKFSKESPNKIINLYPRLFAKCSMNK